MKKKEFIKELESRGIDFEEIDGEIVITKKNGGSVYLDSLTSMPEGVKFENGGDVDLDSLTSMPEGVKFENGGSVYLESLTSMPEGIKVVDSYGMKVNSTKKVKGFTIYDCNFLGRGDHSYVAEKEGFTAHGETIKKAIEDVQFKIMSEKLQKEPINADTMIDVNRYRIVTGACEMGVESWVKDNNMTNESYRADELLKVLEKTNAYGLSKFKELVNF